MCKSETTDHLAGSEVAPQVRERIERLVRSHRVLLFMKGTPAEPRCGFSAATVKLLRRHRAEFHAVDVLADPGLRQGIKAYADWPTIPQLYVDGTFVGGFDILREMDTSGELAPLLRFNDVTADAA